MICDKYTKVASIIFLSGIFFLSMFAAEDTTINKAVRPDASTFPVDCFDCCDTNDITDCQFNEAISLLEIIISDIDALTTFEETCCTELNSKLDSLTTFEQTCCAELNSKIDILLESDCCQNIITQADIDAGPGVIITVPGVYCLASDVTFATGNAITISNTSAEVVLDLQCHTITGLGDAVTAISIENSTGGVIVRNGTISNALNGISVDPSSKVTITNINAYNQQQYGISLNAGSNSILVDSVIVNGAGLDGILIEGAVSVAPFPDTINTTVSNAYISSCGSSGLRIDSVIGFIGKNIQSIENGLHGFHLQSMNTFSASITYESCIAQINQQAGFFAESSMDLGIFIINYIDCKSIGNAFGGAPGFSLSPNNGAIQGVTYDRCLAAGCTNGFETGSGQVGEVIYKDCVTHLNSGSGFYVNAQRVTISDCNANSEGGDGITLDVSANDCIVSNCYVSENGNIGINNMSGSSNNLIYSNEAVGNSVANYSPSVPLQLKPTDITGYWINVDPTASVVGEYESKIDAILDCSCCQNLITQADIDTGSFTIDKPGVYCLATDVTFAAGNAITIVNAPAHIVIDLGGHTITGSPGVGDALFIKGASAVTIRNGYINQAGNGIEINSSNNIVVHDVIIYNSAQYGILSEFCFGLTLQNITIEASGKDGVYLGVSNSVMVDTLVLNGNSNNGIQLDGVNGAQLERIQIYYASNNGIALSSARGGLISIIINDAVDTGSQNGSFRVDGFGGGNEIRAINFIDCFSTDSPVGGFIVSSDNAQVTDIVFQDCTVNRAGIGFYLEQINSDILQNVMYKECTVSGCTSGFLVQANDGNCSNILFESCIATQNRTEGFLIKNGRNNLLTNCIATFNDSGVRIVASPFTQCLECESDTNSNHGFEMVSDYCLIESCKAAYNSGIGIFINGANNTQVLNCRSSYNKIGIEDSGAASQIYGNAAFNNFGADYDPPALAATTFAALNAPYWSNVRP